MPHHVTQRGNRRQETFFCDDDYQTYLDLPVSGNYVWCPAELPELKERNQHPDLVQLYGYWVFDESQYGLAIATDLHNPSVIEEHSCVIVNSKEK